MIEKGNPPDRRKRRWTPWKVFFLASGLVVVLLVLLLTLGGIHYTLSTRAPD